MRLLAIDLYSGLGGWAEGFLAEGYDVIGFDVERHQYGSAAQNTIATERDEAPKQKAGKGEL